MALFHFNVHSPQGNHVATCRHAEDAAVLVAAYGNGAQIHYGGQLLWHEGREEQPAGESYDYVAEICHKRAGWTVE